VEEDEMGMPRNIGVVDTLIGFRDVSNIPQIGGLRDQPQAGASPVSYMFKGSPDTLAASDDPMRSVEETLEKMDKHGVEYGMVSLSDARTPEALRHYPKRFVAGVPVDGNQGMDAVRKIVRAVEEHDAKSVIVFPAGTVPQLPIDDKHWYPVYAKCVELNLPVFIATGVPGPRVPMKAQMVELLDEVCYDFPELKIVMRHGGEPWTALAVKLMLKWPNLFYSTSAFAPKHYPKDIIDFANTRGADKIIYAGYFPFGIELERTFSELESVPFKDEVWPKFLRDNARRVLGLDA
jgi:predicted TIM-barrel fold metal-dependent hydrolase